jgi:RNA:NAD 2'-phosphotransferase (TPT1/KptA family)
MDDRIEKISKLISKILRHTAHIENIKMNKSAFVKIKNLLKNDKLKRYNTTEEDIIYLVKINKKNRFEIVNNKIRARQGHSQELSDYYNLDPLKLLVIFTPIPNTYVVHGTFKENLSSIKKNGLNASSRKFIHFTLMHKKNNKYIQIVESGIRQNTEALIIINIEEAIKEGIIFYQASNGVILTEGINGVLYKNKNNFISEIITDSSLWK